MRRPRLIRGAIYFDGELEYLVRCPECHEHVPIDENQFRGEEPIECVCGYEETHNLSGDREEAE